MSCLGPYYSPVPPREWSRVQDSCSLITDPPADTLTVPLININVPYEVAYYYAALIKKGNVLQYKKNSSNLTLKQKYSQIAKGMWTNRNTTWATQSYTYTNPNTLHLKRVGGENVFLNGTPTLLPETCPIITDAITGTGTRSMSLPSSGVPVPTSNIILPLPVGSSTGTSTTIPSVSTDSVAVPVVISDFGHLLCNTTENICTGETVTQKANQNFHPTTDSDVPGSIRELYWNERIQTWYPKTRLTMNNSTDKWPVNAKFILPVNGFNPP